MKTTGKKLFSLFEFYRIMTLAFRSAPLMRKAKAAGKMDKPFFERIMIAVTEVNGCAMCSYYHTKVALEEGFSEDEVRAMLGGEFSDVPEEELDGVLFAQHYADTRGYPSKESWQRIVEQYDETGAYGVLAVTRMIMMGNAIGIPSGSFLARFSKKDGAKSAAKKIDPRSNLAYELMMMLAMVVFMPFAGLTALIMNLVRVPFIRFRP